MTETLLVPQAALEALDIANDRRRLRTLTPEAIRRAVNRVDAGEPWAVEAGGTVANSYSYPAVTTIVFAARVDGTVHVGCGVSPCPHPSPGRAWSCLTPWRSKGADRHRDQKLRAWTKAPGVVACVVHEAEEAVPGHFACP